VNHLEVRSAAGVQGTRRRNLGFEKLGSL